MYCPTSSSCGILGWCLAWTMSWLKRNWKTSVEEIKAQSEGRPSPAALCPPLSGRHGRMSGPASLKGTVRSWMGTATSCPVPEGSWCLVACWRWPAPRSSWQRWWTRVQDTSSCYACLREGSKSEEEWERVAIWSYGHEWTFWWFSFSWLHQSFRYSFGLTFALVICAD